MTRVLVTGAAGFVGSHVVRCFEEHGATVIGVDVGDDFPEHPVDVVVSLAASADPRQALEWPAMAYANSTAVMLRTLDYARSCGARVLHVSTNEAHPARGPYGGAKACQEVVCETYPDVPVTVVVTQSLFGERQQRDKLVPTAIRALLAGTPITLQQHDGRFVKRPFLHVRNLAQALVWLAVNNDTRERVHVGAVETLSVSALVGWLAEVLDREPLIEAVPAGDRPGHEAHVDPIGCDLGGWEPRYGVVPALRDVARWYRERPEWL